MAFDSSLFEQDVGYYEVLPGRWLPGKFAENGPVTFSRKAVDAAISLDLRDDDVMIATYPKTGQTWTMTIIRLILQVDDLEAGTEVKVKDLFQRIPFIETEAVTGSTGADIFRNLEAPRIMKTHLPFELWRPQLDKHPNLKVIQTLRNPKDTLVSFYHHYQSDRMCGLFKGSWDQFFEMFQKKQLGWGDFFQNNAEWYKFNKNRKESLVLFYEEMKKDHRGHVVKIAEFLGYQLSDKVVDLIVEKTTIGEMKKEINPVVESFASWKSEKSGLIRKGGIGGWSSFFSEEQSQYVDSQCQEVLGPLGIKFEYS